MCIRDDGTGSGDSTVDSVLPRPGSPIPDRQSRIQYSREFLLQWNNLLPADPPLDLILPRVDDLVDVKKSHENSNSAPQNTEAGQEGWGPPEITQQIPLPHPAAVYDSC